MAKLEADKIEETIKTRLRAAEKFGLEGKDLEVYHLFLMSEPYFYKMGEFKRYLPPVWTKNPKDPREHKNWKYFERCLDLTKTLDNCTPKDFLSAVFTRSYDEQVTNKQIYPAMLASEWAVHKYCDWVLSPFKVKPTKSTSDLKAEAVLSTKRYILDFCKKHQIEEKDFFKYTAKGAIFPEAVLLIDAGILSKLVCVGLKGFWDMVDSLDKDIIEEFLPLENLEVFKTQLRVDEKVRQYVREAFDDAIV